MIAILPSAVLNECQLVQATIHTRIKCIFQLDLHSDAVIGRQIIQSIDRQINKYLGKLVRRYIQRDQRQSDKISQIIDNNNLLSRQRKKNQCIDKIFVKRQNDKSLDKQISVDIDIWVNRQIDQSQIVILKLIRQIYEIQM